MRVLSAQKALGRRSRLAPLSNNCPVRESTRNGPKSICSDGADKLTIPCKFDFFLTSVGWSLPYNPEEGQARPEVEVYVFFRPSRAPLRGSTERKTAHATRAKLIVIRSSFFPSFDPRFDRAIRRNRSIDRSCNGSF